MITVTVQYSEIEAELRKHIAQLIKERDWLRHELDDALALMGDVDAALRGKPERTQRQHLNRADLIVQAQKKKSLELRAQRLEAGVDLAITLLDPEHPGPHLSRTEALEKLLAAKYDEANFFRELRNRLKGIKS